MQVWGVGGVVGVGGGSSMDVAKLAAFLCGDTRFGLVLCPAYLGKKMTIKSAESL